MVNLAYGTVYRMNDVQARMQLVQSYQQTGILSATARAWHTSRYTVRTWGRRYQAEGEAGLLLRVRQAESSPW